MPSHDAATPAIETRDLTKRYGDVVAVDGLDLAIDSGVVYGFLGPNGSGKTTTMRMLTTLTRPTAGEAFVAGTSITDREGVIDHLGYLPESPPVFDELSARENLHYVAALHDIPRDVASERIASYLERFDLVDAADRRVEGYSKGMRQKLGMVQAVIHEPEVIFLDEPTSGLDPRAARTVKDLVAELADHDVTIFLSTHILSVVEELADKVGVLHEGDLVAEGTPAELKRRAERDESTSLESAFLNLTEDRDDEPVDAVEEPA
ncbi:MULTISPECIES: ABC transporter ATP-binding protein [Halolamina]|uniref:ABC-2 type transport system ATP-binding protein n=1 Tax=Halolamina pelagica TaxID=699431 RepID=A0A1I5U0T0_9EURY|nr:MULTISPECIES: ABC transporter ATP-binding protein [Halolamina]NHX36739.1 ABC transporter ATP-binding protein [Halolamina sp. R1-12]SFP88908.1 ABC-2 type transport system ATP-binding protein [Halolamina pelagica]